MKGLIGGILLIVGGAIMLYGAGSALRELIGLYQGALSDPLGQPQGAEKDTSDAMIRGVMIGAIGIPPFLIGTIMVKAALYRKLLRRR